MYESVLTGECGSFGYMLRNLISRGRNGLFLNVKWHRLAWREYEDCVGLWIREPMWKAVLNYIKSHAWARAALVLAACGDCMLWLTVAHIF